MGYIERKLLTGFSLWSSKKPLVGNLDLDLTERCNNNCVHCCVNLPATDDAARTKELSTEEIMHILQQAAGLGALWVRFTGGEPLLRTDFEDLYLFARKLGLRVLLFTNARLIGQRLADLFARIPPLMPIEISVYGMRQASYEAVSRDRGSFAQFRRGLGHLHDRNVPFVVKCPLLPPNRGEIEEFESWAARLPWMNGPLAYGIFLDKRSRHDDPEKDRRIAAMRLTPEEGIAIMTRDLHLYRRGMTEFCRAFLTGPPGDRLFRCGVGCGGAVDAYGFLQPCLNLRHSELTYDLRRGSLEHAVKTLVLTVDELRALNPEYLKRCARCFLHGLCDQCPAKSWTENGSLDTPVEYLCNVAHSHARLLGMLGPHEHAWDIRDWRSRIEKVFRA